MATRRRYPKITMDSPDPMTIVEILIAELIGTGMLVFFGCLSVGKGFTIVGAAIGWGTAVGGIIHCFGHISYAHINPCVTIPFVLLGKLSPIIGLMYIVAQLLGSILGYLLLKVLAPGQWFEKGDDEEENKFGFCCTHPGPHTTDLKAVGFEFMATMFLVALVLAILDARNVDKDDSFAIKAALVVMCDVIAIGNLTGASINPARSFGPALITGSWNSHWVYWLGPIGGSLFTTLLYIVLFHIEPEEIPEEEE